MATRFVFDKSALPKLAQASREVVEKATNAVADDARSAAPVDTGALVSSIDTHVEVDSVGATGYVYADVDYAAEVELGTSKSRAQPYLKPALYTSRRF